MRIWLDPDKIAARGLTAGDVVAALRAQNVQVASGVLNQPPVPSSADFQLHIQTLGRLIDDRQFREVIVRTDRSEERRVGQEWDSTGSSRWAPSQSTQETT